MGDIAEQLIYESEYGLPRQPIAKFDKQWAERGDARRKDAVNGLKSLLRHKGVKDSFQQTSLILEFCALNGIVQPQCKDWFGLMCCEVQKQFEPFVKWLNNKLGLPNYGKRKKPKQR
jgi:hypothetical protein